ncbi:serine/threonine-protein phosphatase 4 catalytic subunit [Nematocida sp. LUAm3]|nr:serine/threonine-protein phosphatase 4 catalytic subunit [Nematocida sp. LUAm3]KAI5175485.1 serine/threonine-protein phosphatase 4 catalytic subunit [Nematocida sp. LUAm2]KAI5178485.1 serine/threonine-protein phosphatase 4 catalytic subunit [Nematocida sp. LUAm1]
MTLTKSQDFHKYIDDEFIKVLKEDKVPLEEVLVICTKCIDIFSREGTLLRLPSDLMVVGDIHGQFFDLLNLLNIGSPEGYLFLGDYVDRGVNSLECILLLMHMKIRHPEKIWMLRGNHESKKLTLIYGFYEECIRAYGTQLPWQKICEVFDYLPLAAVVNESIFAVHGGIGPSVSIEEIEKTFRVQDVPIEGIVSELLWSDPDIETETYKENTRGAGFLFGEKQVDDFLRETGMKMIIRSHQLVDAGYSEMFNKKLITIWSAPNYCYRCMNKAAVAYIEDTGDITYFEVPKADVQKKGIKPPLYFL